jgi:hypothetical protein
LAEGVSHLLLLVLYVRFCFGEELGQSPGLLNAHGLGEVSSGTKAASEQVPLHLVGRFDLHGKTVTGQPQSGQSLGDADLKSDLNGNNEIMGKVKQP